MVQTAIAGLADDILDAKDLSRRHCLAHVAIYLPKVVIPMAAFTRRTCFVCCKGRDGKDQRRYRKREQTARRDKEVGRERALTNR